MSGLAANPVFGNELRKSLFRRKPIPCFAGWAGVLAALVYVVSWTPAMSVWLFLWFPYIFLPLLTPPFAAGAFAKEKEQRTWQDLFLTTLTTQQILRGKFLAAYFPILIMLATMLAPVAIGYTLSLESQSTFYWSRTRIPDVGSDVAILIGKCLVQTVFYVMLAFVCSHYCKTARVALGVCYVSLAVYTIAVLMLLSTIQVSGYGGFSSMSQLEMNVGEEMHLLTCGILAVGFWVLLSVGLRFRADDNA